MTDLVTQPPPAAAPAVLPGAAAQVVRGRAAVRALLPEYDQLARTCGLPVTAREPWIRAQLDVEPEAAPWVAAVRADDGTLLAAAVLLDRAGDQRGRVVLAGGGEGHRTGVAAVGPAEAACLGAVLAAEVERRAVVPEVELGPLPDDERTGWLATALAGEVMPTDPVPWVRTDKGPEVTAYLSHGTRKTLRKARNRMATDGLTHEVRFSRDAQVFASLLPAMEQAFRDRDREHGLPCLLDTPHGLRLWRGRVLRLLDAGCLEVATLTVDGLLAAYVLGIVDGNRYGVLEGRFFTKLSRYAPGRMLEAAVLQRVVEDRRFVGLDWMTGVAPETLLAANDIETAVTVRRPGVSLAR
jgi:CelD/BcsL family acetyltransferase involved in cellulose biosynthesis